MKDPNGAPLYPRLLLITERGADGRPTACRILYDDEVLGDVVPNDTHALLVWMAQDQGKPS